MNFTEESQSHFARISYCELLVRNQIHSALGSCRRLKLKMFWYFLPSNILISKTYRNLFKLHLKFTPNDLMNVRYGWYFCVFHEKGPDISAFVKRFQPIPAHSSLFQTNPAYSGLFHPIPSYSSLFQSIPAYYSLLQRSPAFSSLFQPILALFQCIEAFTSLFQPTPSYSSIFHPIPAYFSLLQPSPAHSSPWEAIPAYSRPF